MVPWLLYDLWKTNENVDTHLYIRPSLLVSHPLVQYKLMRAEGDY